MQPQQVLPGPTSFSINRSQAKRGRRTRPLTDSGKIKAAAVRKNGACFRCIILKTGCNDMRPCEPCKKTEKPSSRARRLSWMRCIVHTVSTYSIYTPDPDAPQSLTPVSLHALESMLKHIRLPSNLSMTLDLGFFVTKYAEWISHTTPDIRTGKPGLVCTSTFQSVGGQSLGDPLIEYYRLLLWTASLLYLAMNWEIRPQDVSAHETALLKMKKLINACGNKVVRLLDELCHPGAIHRMPPSLRKQLFLVVVGVGLSATYMVKESQNFSVPSTAVSASPTTIAYRDFIAVLASIGTYIGHECSLFPIDVNWSTAIDPAQRRSDQRESYTWQIPSTLSKRLLEELRIVESPDLIPATVLRNLGQQEPLRPESSATSVRGSQGDIYIQLQGQEARSDECQDCLKEGQLCIFCQLICIPESDAPCIDVSTKGLLLVEERSSGAGYDIFLSTRRPGLGRNTLGTSPHQPEDNRGDLIRTTKGECQNCRTKYVETWGCCQCHDFPHVANFELSCCMCEHKRCAICKVEQLERSDCNCGWIKR